MQQTSLIPLILHELGIKENYGLEIAKNISVATSGKIDIKQANLYSILKKLEKSRLISSFWVDSDIGGKRHYYKLTDLGKAQLKTYPSYQSVVFSLLLEEKDNTENNKQTKSETEESEVLAKELQLNKYSNLYKNNTELLKEIKYEPPKEKYLKEKNIANNVIAKKKENELNELQLKRLNNINYSDYVDYLQDSNYIKAKTISKKIITTKISICFVLLIFSTLYLVFGPKFNANLFYYLYSILGVIIPLILIPFFITIEKYLKLKIYAKKYKYDLKKQLTLRSAFFIVIIGLIIIFNTIVFKFDIINFVLPCITAILIFSDVIFKKIAIIKNDKF